jgi:iron(III) transport system permease protein
VPGRRTLEQLMAVPYYMTPLLGAFAWSLLGAPESGFVNQVWRALGGTDALINLVTPFGIAWVMALFEGSVAFVMIGAVMKSMDPALEEASQVIGASRLRTMLRVTLPLVAPGVLGAAILVFAEMLGSFSAALVLGNPDRFYVVTTAMYQLVSQYPPRIPLAAAMGVSLFAVMFLMLFLYRRLIAGRSYVTISGKAFRPRVMDVGRLRWLLFAVCVFYVLLSVALPLMTLAFASVQKIAVAFPAASNWTLANYQTAFTMNAVRAALGNSLLLGVATASIGVVLMGLISWLIYRSRLPGSGFIEYLVMFPQAVPRLVFAFGMMWAWIVFPIPIYGTLWLLLIAYLTVFLPLGVRTISGVMLQIDKSLEECAQMCGAPWGYRIRTVTMPLLRPGLLAAWLLLFIASVRELGASILLMGPNAKVVTPTIVESWFATSAELTAAMALIQTLVIAIAMVVFLALTRRASMYAGE